MWTILSPPAFHSCFQGLGWAGRDADKKPRETRRERGEKKSLFLFLLEALGGSTWRYLATAMSGNPALGNTEVQLWTKLLAGCWPFSVFFPLCVALLLGIIYSIVPSSESLAQEGYWLIGVSPLGQVGVWVMWHTSRSRRWYFFHPREDVGWRL